MRAMILLVMMLSISTVVFAGPDPARQAAQKRGTESPADGVWHVYDRNGALLREENYRSYRLNGEVRTFYPSGALKELSIYVDGRRQGPTKGYFENGSLALEGTYVDNNFHGMVRRFYDTGELESVSFYKGGNLDGEKKTYFKTGVLSKAATYLDGVLNGTVLSYDETGKIIAEEKFNNGALIGRVSSSSDALLIQQATSLPKKNAASAAPVKDVPKLSEPINAAEDKSKASIAPPK